MSPDFVHDRPGDPARFFDDAVMQLFDVGLRMEGLVQDEGKKVTAETACLILTLFYDREPHFPIHAVFCDIEMQQRVDDAERAMALFVAMVIDQMGPREASRGGNEANP